MRVLRENAGLTQRELGDRLSVAGPTVARYENGKAQLKADELPRLAAVLNVHPRVFFEDDDEVNPRETLPSQGISLMTGDDLAEEFKAFIGTKADSLPPHEQRAVALAAGIIAALTGAA